ncbi:MAG: Hsp70 family protein, partial [Bacteroidetes bacterium]|nr:Hsp70 family protein [Bacteroidota bacterium]
MEIPISVFLEAVTQETAGFLNEALPALGGEKYWENYVIPPLSPNQKRQLEREQKSSIDELDFAALIKVLIKHWSEISYKLKIKDPDDSRTILHGMKDIRNKYSHSGAKRPANETVYRHLDNIYQYLVMIHASEDVVGKVTSEKNRVLVSMQPEKDPPQNEAEENPESGEREEPEVQDSTPAEIAPESKFSEGVPLGILTMDAEEGKEARKLLGQKTFIGIDFGTSTTIVSQVTVSEDDKRLTSRPIPIKQFDDMGLTIEDILVPTCIAWTGSQLLIGQGAAALKTDYEYGKNIWFSFKMKLGIDLGKPYYRSLLSGDEVPVTIQNPQQAAVVFFNYLREQIEYYVKENSLPKEIVYAVSVPASFEANQRMDLVNALHDAGLKIPEYGIIDEPNAAFISYLVETIEYGKGVIEGLPGKHKRILVFDFGAGTCDISILEIEGS